MGVPLHSQGGLWTHRAPTDVSSTSPSCAHTRPQYLAPLPPHPIAARGSAARIHGAFVGAPRSGAAADPRNLVAARVSSLNCPSTYSGSTWYCQSGVRSQMLRLRGARSEGGALALNPSCNKRWAMSVAPHRVGCRFLHSKAGFSVQATSKEATVQNVQDSRVGYGHRISSHSAAHPQTVFCKFQPRSRNERPGGVARCSVVDGMKMDVSSNSSSEAEIPPSSKGVFPGGLRRAEVRLPGLVLRVSVEEVHSKEEEKVLLEGVSAAVAGGVTMVVLEASGEGGMGGAKLYDAACALKTMLRGRAELLVAERVDIAAAAGADGVLLSDEGLPAVVARRMMQNAVLETSVLPLVARSVSSAQSALTATASEGADLLILQTDEKEDDVRGFVESVCEKISIPVFLDAPARAGLDLLQEGANGLVLNTTDIVKSSKGDVPRYVSALMAAIGLAVQRRKGLEKSHVSAERVQVMNIEDVEDGGAFLGQPEGVAAPSVEVEEEPVEKQAKLIVEEERVLLTAMVALVKEASPEMEEVSLLVDAVKQLDELFLSVVVGEFNSGKSSVINALLGKRFLREGVLPTTNEITLLRHASDGGDTEERSERHPDGHFLRYLPADLLKQMNLVDTPGTNVILQRQQRLTEEFVPRADLVLFVLSADRPLTESEVTFLRYIRQWGKKIIFILNKSDVLSTYNEVEEVRNFIRENAQRLLSVEQALVYPVSARQALQAKLSASLDDGAVDLARLTGDPLWTTSGFQELEDFIFGFIGASTDRGAERLRLKLETPLGIAVALLAACDRQLVAEALKAESDLKALAEVQKQLQRYEQAMQNDAILQRQRTLAVVEAAKGRANKFVDSILRLSNVEAIGKYLIGSDRVRSMPVSSGFDSKVIGSSVMDVQKALEEHEDWIESNSVRQLSSYRSLVRSRWPQVNEDVRESAEDSPVVQLRNGSAKQEGGSSGSLAVLEGFDTNAALVLLEQEMKEVVISTFSGLGAAGISASVLTTILPSTMEDLIALGVCSAGGLVGVWNLPSRREGVKRKVTRVAESLARQIEDAMKEDLQQSIDAVQAEVEDLTRPYRKAAEAESIRVAELQKEVQKLDSQLKSLRQRVQNVGT